MKTQAKVLVLRFGIAVLLFSVCGCVTAPKIGADKPKTVFYPAKPEEPRLQFLTSFSSSDDLEGPLSPFSKFIVGSVNNTKPIIKPYGVSVRDNKIYICDTVHNSIDILDLVKRKLEYFTPKDESRLLSPINLCFDIDGNMYVADSGRGQVLVFDPKGNSLDPVGKKSEFKPTDVLIKDNKIYITDLKAHAVKVFRLENKEYMFSIPREGAKEEAKLFSPTNIAMDKEGNIYVSDIGGFKVQKYGPDGEYLMSIGNHGDSPGQFIRPKGIAVDYEGRIYVVDAAFENVQVFDKDGKLLLFFAEPGSSEAASLVLPAGITIDYSLKDYFSVLVDPGFEVEYLVFVTSQYGERKLSIFGFGHKK